MEMPVIGERVRVGKFWGVAVASGPPGVTVRLDRDAQARLPPGSALERAVKRAGGHLFVPAADLAGAR